MTAQLFKPKKITLDRIKELTDGELLQLQRDYIKKDPRWYQYRKRMQKLKHLTIIQEEIIKRYNPEK